MDRQHKWQEWLVLLLLPLSPLFGAGQPPSSSIGSIIVDLQGRIYKQSKDVNVKCR
jgi:hypothetical protein